MKVEPREADRFTAKPPSGLFAVLVFGPDQGLVRERADKIAKSAAPDLKDPFQISELSEEDFAENPGRLFEEAAAIPMLGGRRVVRVRGASNSHAGVFETLLDAAPKDALVIAEAGDLAKSSALRRVFEEAENAAAVPCYLDSEQALEDVVEETMKRAGLTIEPAALAEAVSRLGSDRALTRRELEKLVLYADRDAQVTLAHVLAVMGDESELRMEAICDAAGEGDYVRLDRQLARLWESGVSPVAIVRVALGHFQRMLAARAKVDEGANAGDLVKSMRVHFSRQDSFRVQLARWNVARFEQALELLYEAEILCKTTAVPSEAAVGRALFNVAALAGT